MSMRFYGFDGKRFGISSDPAFNFAHSAYSEARARLLEAMRQGEGYVVLTGAPGTGKTILIDDLATRLERDGSIVGKVPTLVNADDLALLVAFAFGIEADASSKANVLTKLKDKLIDNNTSRRPIIISIDEAQSLSVGALQELHLLFDLLAGRGYAVKVLLAGQERLWERLRQPECGQVRHLITASCRLQPLGLGELRDYVAHVLKEAGWRGNPEISADALHLICQHTDGVPRLINLVMRRLLLHGSLDEVRVLGGSDVESVVEQLEPDHPELALDKPKQTERTPPSPSGPLAALDFRCLDGSRPGEHPLDQRNVLTVIRRKPDATVQSLTDWIRRVRDRNRILVLRAVSAAAISAALLLVVDLDDTTVASTAPHEVNLGTKSSLACTQYRPQSNPMQAKQSLASNKRLATANHRGTRDLRDRVEKSMGADPDGAPDTSAIAGSTPTSCGIQGPLGETPETNEPVEIAEATSSSKALVESNTTHYPSNGVEELYDREAGNTANGSATNEAEPAPLTPQDLFGQTTGTGGFTEITGTAPSSDGRIEGQDAEREADKEVAALLKLADTAMAENRLTVPSGDNAHAHWQAALALDPESAEAKAGIQRIGPKYGEAARIRHLARHLFLPRV